MINIELPPIDEKYLSFVEGELVQLVKEVDDKDYARIYEVKQVNGDQLTVEVVGENCIIKNPNSNKETMIGRIFKNVDKRYFQSYL